MRKTTVAQTIRNREYEMKRKEILQAFNTITRAEVVDMLDFYKKKGILKVYKQGTQIRVDMKRTRSAWNFEAKVLKELHRTCTSCKSTYDHWGFLETTRYKIADGSVKVFF